MGEIHAYGTSLGCISRRLFVLGFASTMTVLCYLHVAGWLAMSHLSNILVGNPWVPPHQSDGCVGTACYEILSCFGMKDATQHVREPLSTLTGALFFPLGALAAYHGLRSQLRLFGLYLAISAAVHFCLLAGDGIFFCACDMYPTNVVEQILIHGWRLPLPPIRSAVQEQLGRMTVFPRADVDALAANDPLGPMAWYFIIAGLWAAILAHVAYETLALGNIVERGPLGLGVHYGIAQFDEMLNHDAIRKRKERAFRGKFIDDAELPFAWSDGPALVHGYEVHPSRGSDYGTATRLRRGAAAPDERAAAGSGAGFPEDPEITPFVPDGAEDAGEGASLFTPGELAEAHAQAKVEFYRQHADHCLGEAA